MRARLISLVGATVCALGLGACGQTTTKTVVQTNTTTTTTSLTTTNTVVHHAGTLTIHDTTTVTMTHTAGPLASQGQISSGVLTLTGQGTENMGTVQVPSQSLLRWSCPSCSSDNFIIGNNNNDPNQIDVNALDQAAGQTVVDAGTYHDFQVEGGNGPWTVTITPGG